MSEQVIRDIKRLESYLLENGITKEWIEWQKSEYKKDTEQYLNNLSNKQSEIICRNYERDDI